MIYNFSYRDSEMIRLINNEVGKPFTIIDRFKLGGIGSPRFILDSASDAIKKHIPDNQSTQNFSVELRPKGVIVHFKKFTEHYTWVIPYYHLTLYYSDQFSIYSGTDFMKVAADKLQERHQKFLKKIMRLKSAYAHKFAFPL